MGKPPISNAAMSCMYETMQRMRAAKGLVSAGLPRAERAAFLTEPESLFAALLSQLHRRDTLLTQGRFPGIEIALETYFPDRSHGPSVHTCPGSAEECAAVAAGVALKQAPPARVAVPRPVVIAVIREFPALDGVLSLVDEHNLSLLLVVQAEPETRADAQRRLRTTRVPVMTVDAMDAIAVCRVAQESLLRARNGWGGVVIHTVKMSSSLDPLHHMESHLRARGMLQA